MDTELMEISSERFDEVIEDIKQRNLSRNNMPKLIVGTGLSIIYGVPGMIDLAKYIDSEVEKNPDTEIARMWRKRYSDITANGLEAGLANLTDEENLLVDVIKNLTAKYILESEEILHSTIWERNTGFSKLMAYLSNTVSVNARIIDIMTPNYDRIIEIVCDKLNIGVITGFMGNIYSKFDRNILRKPQNVYNCKQYVWVRLFKPHGSINWINESGQEYLTNDYATLSNKKEFVEVVAPGNSKYRTVMINSTFRCMREEFNELLSIDNNYSLLIYGYGFNDDHFDTVLFDSFQKNVLILSKYVKQEIIKKAMERKNITIFYQEESDNYMIYKSKRYRIDLPLWDIDQFANTFIA